MLHFSQIKFPGIVKKMNERGSGLWVVGLARQCPDTLIENWRSLKNFADGYEVNFVAIVSESDTRTWEIASQISQTVDNFRVISEMDVAWSSRTHRMSTLRNQYVELLRADSRPNFRTVVVVDWDLKLELECRLSEFDNQRNSAIFAHQKGAYYDIYALRDDLLQSSYDEQIKLLRARGMNPFRALLDNLVSNQLRMGKLSDPHEVESAFGGLAIYPKKVFDTCEYSDRYGCEHVALNKCAASKVDKLLVDPRLAIPRVHEHTKYTFGWRLAILRTLSILPLGISKHLAGIFWKK